MRPQLLTATLAALALLLSSPAQAELPPGAYEELLNAAPEVLDIRITKVLDASATPTDQPEFICDATVLDVKRSASGIKRGQTIQFKSYYVPESTRQRGWAGPKPPPRLSAGQTWRISLKPGEDGAPFQLAAYGRSFQPLDSQNAQNNSPDRLGVNAMPAAGGGLLIANINRRSIADKLGLRSGDRVIEINGTPINANAEVGPAIAQDQNQLAIKFSRNGETIELTLKR